MTSTLRPASLILAEHLVRNADGDVVANVVPELLRSVATNQAVFDLLLARPELYPEAARRARALRPRDAYQLLTSNYTVLPPSVLDVVAPKLTRTLYSAAELAERADLTPAVAVRLTKQKRRRVQWRLDRNALLPVEAAWRMSPLLGGGPTPVRWSRRRADETILGLLAPLLAAVDAGERIDGTTTVTVEVPSSPGTSVSAPVTAVLGACVSVLDSDHMAAALTAAFVRLVEAGAADIKVLGPWAQRGVYNSAAMAFVQLVDAHVRYVASLDLPLVDTEILHGQRATVIHLACSRGPRWASRLHRWVDTGSVAAALESSCETLRNAALTHPDAVEHAEAVLARVTEGTTQDTTQDTTKGTSRDTLRSASVNPALSPAVLDRLCAHAPDQAWMLLGAENLRADQRVAMAAGVAGGQVASIIADALRLTVLPAWVKPWLDPALLGTLAGAAEPRDGSVLIAEVLDRWPDQLDALVGVITARHHLTSASAARLAAKIGAMDSEQAAVAGGLLEDWDQSIAALVAAVDTVVPAK